MKITKEFILRQIADDYVLVPVGNTALEFNGLVTINELGAFIWNKLQENKTEEEIIEAILNEYDVDRETVKKDVQTFMNYLLENNVLEQ